MPVSIRAHFLQGVAAWVVSNMVRSCQAKQKETSAQVQQEDDLGSRQQVHTATALSSIMAAARRLAEGQGCWAWSAGCMPCIFISTQMCLWVCCSSMSKLLCSPGGTEVTCCLETLSARCFAASSWCSARVSTSAVASAMHLGRL